MPLEPWPASPTISVDTKKKELVGDFKNAGCELRPKGQPEPVRVHDFALPELGKVPPCGLYDIAANAALGEAAKVPASAACWKASVGQPRDQRRHRCLCRRKYPALVG